MDQGPIAQSGAWLAVGREIAETLERVDALAFQRFVDVFRDERPSLVLLRPGTFRACGGNGRDAVHAHGSPRAFCRRSDGPIGPRSATGSASYQAPAIPPVTLHFARIAKDEGAESP